MSLQPIYGDSDSLFFQLDPSRDVEEQKQEMERYIGRASFKNELLSREMKRVVHQPSQMKKKESASATTTPEYQLMRANQHFFGHLFRASPIEVSISPIIWNTKSLLISLFGEFLQLYPGRQLRLLPAS